MCIRDRLGAAQLDALGVWKAKVLGSRQDINRRRRYTRTRMLCGLAGGLLHTVLVGVFMLPSVFYMMEQNVERLPTVFAPFKYSVVVVACNVCMVRFVLPSAAIVAAHLARYGLEEDVIAFDMCRLRTLFWVAYCGGVVGPVLSTVLLDENCLRYYLKFSPNLLKIMEIWEIAMTGASAYRHGFCLSKVIYVYAPIWHITAALDVLLLPSVMVLQATSLYEKVRCFVQSKLPFWKAVEGQDEQLENQVKAAQSRVATVLSAFCVGVGFGVWSPTLLFFLALQGPTFLFASLLVDALLQARDQSHHKLTHPESFCRRAVDLVKVPLPRWLPTVGLVALCVCTTLVFLDFGFAVASWVVFWVPLIPYWAYQRRGTAQGSVEHLDGQEYTLSSTEHSKGTWIQAVDFVAGPTLHFNDRSSGDQPPACVQFNRVRSTSTPEARARQWQQNPAASVVSFRTEREPNPVQHLL
eukprot:TRINITY_DN16103_c0_g1_i1.p1 TRINITY_DN16103_c0_g1~~TRINITY_DN16103_c0_g1_i1.p1  ORF type:complete len:467 (+),score=98.36 TRINITY_DN16103_c0_g1_i1:95-1495(+)